MRNEKCAASSFRIRHFSLSISSMLLRVLPSSPPSTDLIRLFHQSQLEWSRHLGEETQLDFGRWIHNPELAHSGIANCLHDAFLLPSLRADQLIDQMEINCKEAGVPWRCCSLNPSASPTLLTELADALTAHGWTAQPLEILCRGAVVQAKLRAGHQVTIIPSRASYGHYRQLMKLRASEETQKALPVTRASGPYADRPETLGSELTTTPARAGGPCHDAITTVETDLLHLDDPHLDSLLALRDGQPVGCISLLTTGEVGTLRDWYVAPAQRNHGIGKVLLDRALEICARAQLKHIMMGVGKDAGGVISLCKAAGFSPIGRWENYRRA